MGEEERALLLDAFDSNWIAPLGPHVNGFEEEMAQALGVAHAAALSSGTAALHLALLMLGVEPGDKVICSSMTFAASSNAIRYCNADPVFIDCEASSWNMDPALLAEELGSMAAAGDLPKAVMTVDLYGQCCDYDIIEPICEKYGVPLLEDAAESLGATWGEKKAGSFGKMAVLSFNGNKIITTGGGGMLLSDDEAYVKRARHLATQAREPAPHYEHKDIGYNYRLSNLLAALGRGQLRVLTQRVDRRRAINQRYQERLGDVPGVVFMPEAAGGRSNRWLTCLTIDSAIVGVEHETIRLGLEKHDIESRPVWKPMHLQPVYRDCRFVGSGVSDGLFEKGLCLPSGSSMSDEQVDRVAGLVREMMPAAP